MKKRSLTLTQKLIVLVPCIVCTLIGFMIKLPAAFRHIDKELHAAFYFMAAAVLNILFAGTNLLRHIIIFVSLYIFGMAIEYAQAWSNRFFSRRIHGRFDPEDLQWNLKGLVAFSICWILITLMFLAFGKPAGTNKRYESKVGVQKKY